MSAIFENWQTSQYFGDLEANKFKAFEQTQILKYCKGTDYGLPMKHFFIKIQNFWAWADKLGR